VNGRVWLDGVLRRGGDASIPGLDRGFTLGDGVFETLLWSIAPGREGALMLEAHLARLSHAAASLGLVADIDEPMLVRAIEAVCADAQCDQAVRITLSRGSGPRGLAPPEQTRPLWMVSAVDSTAPGPVASLVRTDVPRAAGAPSARFKTLSYIDNVMALSAARTAGGSEGLMLGPGGTPACASSANLVVITPYGAVTPPLASGALPGIVRGVLVRSGLVREGELDWPQLADAPAMALTNALVGVRPVAAFEGRVLDIGHPQLAALSRVLAEARAASLARWNRGLPRQELSAEG
jgi:branched-chain amino acid aminotransferase